QVAGCCHSYSQSHGRPGMTQKAPNMNEVAAHAVDFRQRRAVPAKSMLGLLAAATAGFMVVSPAQALELARSTNDPAARASYTAFADIMRGRLDDATTRIAAAQGDLLVRRQPGRSNTFVVARAPGSVPTP